MNQGGSVLRGQSSASAWPPSPRRDRHDDRRQHRGHDVRRETHVVQTDAHVRLEELRRHLGKDEADPEASGDRERQPDPDRQRGAEENFREDRGKRRAKECRVDVDGERLSLEPCIPLSMPRRARPYRAPVTFRLPRRSPQPAMRVKTG